ncbi:MAG: acyclic terpene utilization AtuA family protein, partial [Pseudomonadota bacterium]
ELSRQTGPRYLMFEVLAERTLAVATLEKGRDPEGGGASPWLEKYLEPVLADALAAGVRIVTNMGAANPRAAARRVHALAARLGLRPPKVAVLEGDDLRETHDDAAIRALEIFDGAEVLGQPILAANVYLGARAVAAALDGGCEILLVGRTTDSALALGPLIHEFGWAEDALDRLAAGTLVGHLLECGGQVTGAYFADPGFKDVPDLARVGFPLAEVAEDGTAVIAKAAGTGGCVTPATVTEQILYEMHDPAAYLVPDVTLDVTEVRLTQEGPDRVRVEGARGHAPPETLKATICVEGGWLGEGEMTYAGPNAYARARLAAEVVEGRLRMLGVQHRARFDLIGAGASHDRGDLARTHARGLPVDGEYRMRAALMAPEKAPAQTLVDEVMSLYCSGPAAGGGFRSAVTPQVATASVLIPREAVSAGWAEVAP